MTVVSSKMGSLVPAEDFNEEENMDHDEAIRKFEHLMMREADRAQEAAAELHALVSLLPSEKSRQLARLQARVNHERAKEFRERARQARET